MKPTTNADLEKAVLKATQENRIWINAFSLIRPEERTYLEIGKAVVAMLKEKENLLPLYMGDTSGEVAELQKLTPVLYMSINQS